ncbi:uncharacterized protein J5F26_010462 [Ciconia maguari]
MAPFKSSELIFPRKTSRTRERRVCPFAPSPPAASPRPAPAGHGDPRCCFPERGGKARQGPFSPVACAPPAPGHGSQEQRDLCPSRVPRGRSGDPPGCPGARCPWRGWCPWPDVVTGLLSLEGVLSLDGCRHGAGVPGGGAVPWTDVVTGLVSLVGGGIPATLRGPAQPVAEPCRPRSRRGSAPRGRPGAGRFPGSAVRGAGRSPAAPPPRRRPLDGALVPGKARRGPTARPGRGGAGRAGTEPRPRGAGAVPAGRPAPARRRLPLPTAPTGPPCRGGCGRAPRPAAFSARRRLAAIDRRAPGAVCRRDAPAAGRASFNLGAGGRDGASESLQPKGSERSAASAEAPRLHRPGSAPATRRGSPAPVPGAR